MEVKPEEIEKAYWILNSTEHYILYNQLISPEGRKDIEDYLYMRGSEEIVYWVEKDGYICRIHERSSDELFISEFGETPEIALLNVFIRYLRDEIWRNEDA